MSKKNATIHLRNLDGNKTLCGKAIARVDWVALTSPARANCGACLESACRHFQEKIDATRESLTDAEERLAKVRAHETKGRYRVSTYTTVSTFCYVIAASEEEARRLAFEYSDVKRSTARPGDSLDKLNTWYACEIDGEPVDGGEVEVTLDEKAGAK